MHKYLTVQEIAIAISAKDLNPTVLNPDFLKYSDIIPGDWELAHPPVYSNQLVQLVFQTGVAIVAQPNRIIFLEQIGDNGLQAVQIAAIANRYVETLPNVEYQAIGINPKGFITVPEPDSPARYFSETILAAGSWQQFGQAPMQASLQLAYTLEAGTLNLIINEATLQLADEKTLPVVLFSGNFNHEIPHQDRDQRSRAVHQLIQNWQSDVETFRDLINTHFLPQRIMAIAG